MRRRILLAPWLAAAIAIGLTTAVVAGDRDPRCDTWERSGPPAGIDMATACPPVAATAIGTADVDLDRQPLVPYVVALLVMAGVLAAVGVVAQLLGSSRGSGARAAAAAWWTCGSCGSVNGPDRSGCFACQAPRSARTPTPPA